MPEQAGGNRWMVTGMAAVALALALAVAWWSFPEPSEPTDPRPLAAATPPRRGVPVPVDPNEGLQRVVKAPEEPARVDPVADPVGASDTGTVVLELVLPVGEGCEGLEENLARLEGLLMDVQGAQGGQRQHILRQLGPLMQSVEVEGCGDVPDHRPEVTRVLCNELKERPDDMELMLVAGFAEVSCD